jgi:hypothetical protein
MAGEKFRDGPLVLTGDRRTRKKGERQDAQISLYRTLTAISLQIASPGPEGQSAAVVRRRRRKNLELPARIRFLMARFEFLTPAQGRNIVIL